jgi:hypothetical protein
MLPREVLQLCWSSRISWADMVFAPSVAVLFKWRQFGPEVILLAIGWYLRFSLSYRDVGKRKTLTDVEELLAERGLRADHVTVWRWVQRYGPEMEQRCVGVSNQPTTVGEWTRRTCGSKANGCTCTGRWTPAVRRSTSFCRLNAMQQRLSGF